MTYRTNSAVRSVLLMASVAMLLPIAACNKQDSSPVQAGPKTFASPEDAGKALADAAKAQSQDQILAIFGADQRISFPLAMSRKTKLL